MKKHIFISIFLFLSFYKSFAQSNNSANDPDCEPLATLSIKKFDSGKPFKVVIGNEINYKLKGGKILPISMKMGRLNGGVYSDLFNFSSSPTTNIPPVYSNKGKLYISTNQLPINNSDFVVVKGNLHAEESSMPKLEDTETVNVFFNKNDRNHHNPNVPNWFYYWKQSNLITALLNYNGINFFNVNTCSWNAEKTPINLTLQYDSTLEENYPEATTYARNGFHFLRGILETSPDLVTICPTFPSQRIGVGWGNADFNIRIGLGAANRKDLFFGDGPVTELEGIKTFFSVIVHETNHVRLKVELWNSEDLTNGVHSGYSDIYDLDNDGYKDIWEDLMNRTTPYLFNSSNMLRDLYNNIYNQKELGKFNPVTGMFNYSFGTEYEERECYDKEIEMLLLNINQHDWSFQGKNW